MILELVPSSNMKRPLSSGSSPSSGSPQSKKPRLDNLSLTDADHEKLDEEVVKEVNIIRKFYARETLPALILAVIVLTANGLLDNRYGLPGSASVLLEEDKQLSTAVEAAWENKSFSSIRRMR